MRKSFATGIAIFIALTVVLIGGCSKPKAAGGVTPVLAFSTQPGSAPAGADYSVQPVVAIEDANGNVLTKSIVIVTVSITATSGTSGAVLSGKTTLTTVNGIADFTGLSIDKAGASYTLTATGKDVLTGISNSFNVFGVPSSLSFTTVPDGGAAGLVFTTQPVVEVRDIFGTTITNSSIPVTLTITPHTGVSGAALSGTTTVNAVNGVATFTHVSIDKPGLAYSLWPVSPGTNSPTSKPFNVSGDAVMLIITQQPITATAGTTFSINPEVTVLDANGAVVINSSATITIALSPSSSTGIILSGKLTVNAEKGVATFADLMIDQPKTNCTLMATSPGLIPAQTNPFNIAVPTPTATTLPVPTETIPSTTTTTPTTPLTTTPAP